MSALAWGLVSLGAATGAVLRYVVDQLVTTRVGTRFPYGTLLVNVSGSFVLGLLVGAGLHQGLPSLALAAAGTGLCGGYTTFSTWGYETWRMAEEGRPGLAAANVAASVVLGLPAAGAGLALMQLG